jgi:hypothetical protein
LPVIRHEDIYSPLLTRLNKVYCTLFHRIKYALKGDGAALRSKEISRGRQYEGQSGGFSREDPVKVLEKALI